MNDNEIARRVLAGDREGFSVLVERHRKALFACAQRILDDADAAEDACQDAWADIWRKLATYDPERPFRAWALGFVRNCAYKLLVKRRRNKATVPLEDVPEDAEPSTAGPEQEHDRRVEAERLYRELARLPKAQRDAILLCEIEDLSRAEAGRILGRKPETVGSDKCRGLAALRRRMKRKRLQ